MSNDDFGMNDFVETRIIRAVRELLAGAVNDRLKELKFEVPVIEFGNYGDGHAISPVVTLASCEQTEKERVIRQDVYSLTITFSVQESEDSELYCYAYSAALGRTFYDDPTLGGIVDRAVITGKKYIAPKKANCGEEWGLIITVRVTVEASDKS